MCDGLQQQSVGHECLECCLSEYTQVVTRRSWGSRTAVAFVRSSPCMAILNVFMELHGRGVGLERVWFFNMLNDVECCCDCMRGSLSQNSRKFIHVSQLLVYAVIVLVANTRSVTEDLRLPRIRVQSAIDSSWRSLWCYFSSRVFVRCFFFLALLSCCSVSGTKYK